MHSGDATIVLPAQKLYAETKQKIEDVAQKIAKELQVTGPFNIQFLAKDNKVQVIEINLRSSRTFPFISKVTGIDFIKLAVNAFFRKTSISPIPPKKPTFVAVKAPQFSFARLTGADPILHVEMASTGEVACFGQDLEEALLKAELAVGGKIPKKGIFISLGGNDNKMRFLKSAVLIKKLNLPIYATEKTTKFLRDNKIPAKMLYKIYERQSPNILEYFKKRKVDLAINLVETELKKDEKDHYTIRRAAIDFNIPLFTNLEKAAVFIKAIVGKDINKLPIKSWREYEEVKS